MTSKNTFYGRHFLGIETCLVLLATSAFVAWIEFGEGADEVREVLRGNRGAIYGGIVSFFGALLGFVLTTMSIVITWSSRERFKDLQTLNSYPLLWKIFHSTIRFLACATGSAIVAMIFDRDSSPARAMWHITFFFVSMACVRLYRTIWVLELLVAVFARHTPADDKTTSAGT